jgi:hypothetical protein
MTEPLRWCGRALGVMNASRCGFAAPMAERFRVATFRSATIFVLYRRLGARDLLADGFMPALLD